MSAINVAHKNQLVMLKLHLKFQIIISISGAQFNLMKVRTDGQNELTVFKHNAPDAKSGRGRKSFNIMWASGIFGISHTESCQKVDAKTLGGPKGNITT